MDRIQSEKQPHIFISLPNSPLNIQSLPDLGSIAAGFPSPAGDDLDEEFDVEQYLFGSFYKKVLFKISGDSMIEAGIFDGDIAIVEKGRKAMVGDIVIAFIDGQYSIKYLKKDSSGKHFLQPANKSYSDIYPEDELQIFGVVTSIIRKYKN